MNKKMKAKLLLCALALSSICQLTNVTGVYADTNLDTAASAVFSGSRDELFEAVCAGDLDKFKSCMEQFASNPEEELNKLRGRGEYKNSALHLAIWSENFRLVKYILEHYDVNLDLKNTNNQTPFDCVRALVNEKIFGIIYASAAARKRFHDGLDPYWPHRGSDLPISEDDSSLQTDEDCCSPLQVSKCLMSVHNAVRMHEMMKNIYNIRELTRSVPIYELHRYTRQYLRKMSPFITPDTISTTVHGRSLMYYFNIEESWVLDRWARYIDADDTEYDTCVRNALRDNRIDIFKKLMRRSRLQDNLTAAIDFGNIEAVRIMIDEEGADVNGMATICGRPFHKKICDYALDMVKDYSGRKVDENRLRAVDNSLEIVKLLIERGAGFGADESSLFRKAVRDGNLGVVKILIDRSTGFGVDESSLFREAVCSGNPEIVKLFIDRGANVNEVYANGNTPIIDAMDKGYGGIAMLLIDSGANIGVVDANKLSLLFKSVYNGDFELAKILIEKGSSLAIHPSPIRSRYNENKTILHLAIETFQDLILQRQCASFSRLPFVFTDFYLKELNRREGWDHTYINEAKTRGIDLRKIYEEYLECVLMLIHSGVNINAKDTSGRTALDYVLPDDSRLIDLLKSCGAKRGCDL